MSPTDTPVLHGDWDEDALWSRANMAEAIPGVATPMNWSVWGPVGEKAIRWGFAATGALEADQIRVPDDPRERVLGIFYGRPAAKVDFFCQMGDRIPGASGAMVAEQILGEVPEGLASSPVRRRYPAVLAKMPSLFATIPKRISAAAAQTDMWWRSEVSLAPVRDLPGAIRQMFAAQARMELSLKLTAEAAFAGAQPVFDKLLDVATTVGRPDLAGKVLSGHGSHVETRLVDDLWELSRQRLSLDAYLDRHGYHGPLEGEVSARVWREDPAPVLELARRYAEQEEEHSPSLRASERAVEGERAARELYAALPRSKRPAARLVLTLARTYLPLRGIGKIPFLQSLDVIRAGARRAGDLLATDGHLDDPDDVFFLLLEELREGPAADWRERIAARKTERHEYEHLSLPMQWRGKAPVTPTEIPASGSPIADTPVVVTGVAASPGTYEGPVRVVTDPALTDIEPGEILVAHITDPSWASVLFLAGALVVDIGGALSHTAIVSREMGVPCVTGTDVATGVLRTGDICRVDGTTGRVELIARPEARVN